MPGTTPNRSYPFPVDGDVHDIAGHIEDLARAVDTDTATFVAQLGNEAALRAGGDSALINQLTRGILRGVDHTGDILIQGSYGEYTLDIFAVAVIEFPEPFGLEPVVMANASSSTQQIALGVEHCTPTTANVFGRWLTDGEPASLAIVAFQYIAIGFSPT